MNTNKKYISIKRAVSMEDSIMFLSSYTGPHLGGKPWDGQDVVGTSLDDIDQVATEKLRRLGEINKERQEILKWFNDKAAQE